MQWSLVRDSDTLQLSDRNPFDVISVEGIGISNTRRLTEKGPFQVGHRDVGVRWDARLITMALVSNSASKADADAARDALFAIVRPSDESLTLVGVRDDAQTRQIAVHAINLVDAPHTPNDRIGSLQRYVLQLQAPFPYWTSGTGYWYILGADDPNVGGTGSGQTAGYQVPTEVPTITVESSGIDYAVPLAYDGTADTFPRITVYGPFSGVSIENLTNGTILTFPNIALSEGDWLDIDLAYNTKSVIDDTGANRIADLSTTSDLVTFRLAPGENEIRFTVGSGATGATGLKMDFPINYISL
jgi:hypothetical protein